MYNKFESPSLHRDGLLQETDEARSNNFTMGDPCFHCRRFMTELAKLGVLCRTETGIDSLFDDCNNRRNYIFQFGMQPECILQDRLPLEFRTFHRSQVDKLYPD
jgi:hypothetical protein